MWIMKLRLNVGELLSISHLPKMLNAFLMSIYLPMSTEDLEVPRVVELNVWSLTVIPAFLDVYIYDSVFTHMDLAQATDR